MKRYIAVFFTLLFLIALPTFSMAVEEDQGRCACWYLGYDAQKDGYPIEGDGPGGSKDECDLIGAMQEWEDGWLSAKVKEARKCPYKRK